MQIEKAVAQMEEAFKAVQMPRPPFELENFIIGQHDTPEQQYAQCVVELQIKYDAIRRANLQKRRIALEIEELEKSGDPKDAIDAELKRIDIEEQDRAMIGALREFEVLFGIWQSFPHQYTREELNAAQEEYWVKRLTRQAEQDLLASGRVSQGNQEALRLIGRAPLPQLDHVREVEQRYLEVGDVRVLMVVPTEEKAEDGLPCVEDLVIPSGVQVKIYNVWGKSTAEAYNDAVMTLLNDSADFMLTVEDDTFPPPEALTRLLALAREKPRTIVGAWYPKRNEMREGAPIVIVDGKRQGLAADGWIHEVHTIPMGCTLFPAEVFLQTSQPWFVTTNHLTQDSFFSQKARDAGWKLLCDTSIRCRHIDRETGEVYK